MVNFVGNIFFERDNLLIQMLEVWTQPHVLLRIHRVTELHIKTVRDFRETFLLTHIEEVVYVLRVERLDPLFNNQTLMENLNPFVLFLIF